MFIRLQPEYNWDIMVDQVNKPTISTSITIQADDKDAPNVHFIYICKKKPVPIEKNEGKE